MEKVTKKALRLDIKKILNNLDQRWIKSASQKIVTSLNKLTNQLQDKHETLDILGFYSFFSGEIDITSYLTKWISSKNNVYLPKCNPDGTMQFILVYENFQNQIKNSSLGIPEPDSKLGTPFSPKNSNLTLIIVPGLAFDKEGNRLGRGKGYYDRFMLKLLPNKTIKVGVAWKIQIQDKVPTEKHDIPVNYIITEEDIIKTSW